MLAEREKVKKHYSKKSVVLDFALERYEGWSGKYFYELEEKIILEKLPNGKGQIILDMGMGTGRLYKNIIRRGYNYIAHIPHRVTSKLEFFKYAKYGADLHAIQMEPSRNRVTIVTRFETSGTGLKEPDCLKLSIYKGFKCYSPKNKNFSVANCGM